MMAFVRVLIGDVSNFGFVAAVVALAALLARTGHVVEASVAIPVVILAGVGWLAGR